MNKVNYQSRMYLPELITGFYVRCLGSKPNYIFRVFETETSKAGKPGQGFTLREYDTTGEELPQELKELCIKSKVTERWNK